MLGRVIGPPSSPMRILTVIYSLGKGGTERAAVNFAIAYKALLHDSRLVTRQLGPRQKDLDRNGIPILSLSEDRHCQEIVNWSPEVIHVHSHGTTLQDVYTLKSLCPQAKFIETNVFSVPSEWEHLLHRSYQLSQWCLWLYLQRGGDKGKAAIAPNPVECDGFYWEPREAALAFRKTYRLHPEALVIGRIGQAYDGKWSPVTVQVFERLKYLIKDAQLLLVNPPASIVDLAQSSAFCKDIVIINELNGDDNLRAAYSAMDIFLHTANQGESFGMVLAEAMLCEKPVVTLATPWADNSQVEVVGNQVGGLVADSPQALLHCLLRLANDERLSRRLSRQGRLRVLDNYQGVRVAEAVLQSLDRPCPEAPPSLLKLYNVEGANLLTRLLLKHESQLDLTRFTCDLNRRNLKLLVPQWRRFLRAMLHRP